MNFWTWTANQNANRADQLILKAIEEGLGSWSQEPPSLSRSLLKKWIQQKRVQLIRNNQMISITASSPIKVGDQLSLHAPPPEPAALTPENQPLDILYEDSDLLVINKPAGLTVHPSETQKTNTLVHVLLHHIKSLSHIGGELRPGIVHRLDKDTSGALLIAKNDPTHLALTEVFSKHDIQREYWALTYGAPQWENDQIQVESLIARNPHHRTKMSMQVKEGKKAITHLVCQEKFIHPSSHLPFASWITARLETGRTHQVRVHLNGLNHSVLGDPTYGKPSQNQKKWTLLPEEIKKAVLLLPGQALHAALLGFQHPQTRKWIKIHAPPPPLFQSLLDTLRTYR